MILKKYALKLGKTLGAIAFWVALWFIIARIVDLELIIPSPLSVLSSLWRLLRTADFWISTSFSFARVIVGVGISFVIGCAMACLCWRSKILNALFSPLLSIIKSTPVASFIIIAWLWFDTSALPIFISSLIVIPIITANLSQGIASVDREMIEVARVYRLPLFKRLFKLYIPSVAPYFLAACKSSLGMAWKASVAAELIVLSKNSIGREIYNSKLMLETSDVFAWTVVIIVLSIVAEKLLVLLLNYIGRAARLFPKEGETYAEA